MSGQLLFQYSPLRGDSFNGLFLDNESYDSLIYISKRAFPDFKEDRLKDPYMMITKNPMKLWSHINSRASVKITGLVYSKDLLIAIAHLNNNYTDKAIPHIVLQRTGMNNYTAGERLKDLIEDVQTIPEIKVHGKIGVLTNSTEETQPSIVHRSSGCDVIRNFNTRPEASISVEQQHDHDTDLVITINTEDNKNKTDMYYRGKPVYKGSRGGNYIIRDDGTRQYIKKSDIAS